MLERAAPPLLYETQVHPRRLRLDDDRERAFGLARVEVAVDRVGVDDDEVVLLPVVALAVVDLVARPFEDVKARLVLVAVPVIRAAREELDEVHLERLGQEGLVPGPEDPPRVRLLRVTGMRHRPGVGHDARAAHAIGLALVPAVLRKSVLRGADPAQEDAAFAVAHGTLIHMGGRMV